MSDYEEEEEMEEESGTNLGVRKTTSGSNTPIKFTNYVIPGIRW